jgi:NAD(P)-dependent dehydrogenase (short-subunit alcohol dehydrogenase family)
MATSMTGKTVLITGATRGIGRAAAQALAEMGATVVLVGRDRTRAETAVAEIGQATSNPYLTYLVGDLSSMAEVRRVADEFESRHERLHVLLNNAGAVIARRKVSVDGFEMTFALNHMSYFLLTNLLLDRLTASAPGRVICVSSDAHRAGRLDLNDLQGERSGMGIGGFGAYGRSKLMNVLFTYELARRLDGTGVTANTMHPGFVATGFGLNNGGAMAALLKITQPFARSAERGADTAVFLASDPEVAAVTGRYFTDRRPVASSPTSYDEALQRELWAASAGLAGLPEPAGA